VLLVITLAFTVTFSQTPQVTWDGPKLDEFSTALKQYGVEHTRQKAKDHEISLYDIGVKILRIKGPAEAMIWYKALADELGEPLYLYGMARCQWKVRDLDSTKSLCLDLLELEPDTLMKARVYYLLGRVEQYQSTRKVALRYYQDSFEHYGKLGKNGGRYLACFGIASTLVEEGNFAGAREYIKRAREFNLLVPKPYPDAHLLHLEGEISLLTGEFDEARFKYEQGLQSLDPDNGDNETRAVLELKIYFLDVLHGYYEDGLDQSEQLEETFLEMRDPVKYHTNAIIRLLIFRCGGKMGTEKYDRARKQITDFTNNHDSVGKRMNELLEFVERIPCPTLEEK